MIFSAVEVVDTLLSKQDFQLWHWHSGTPALTQPAERTLVWHQSATLRPPKIVVRSAHRGRIYTVV